MDDELLVVRAQLGERAAFAELVGRWHAPVRTFARRMLDDQRADDVAQEIWVAVLRGLPRLADPGRFVPWLFTIARRAVLNRLRHDYTASETPGRRCPARRTVRGDLHDGAVGHRARPLPERTHLSFALLVLICPAWTAYGLWSATRRAPLFALDRVVAAWLGLAAALLTTTVTLTLAAVRDEGVPLALAAGAVLTAAAILLVTRAHARRTALLRRKADLNPVRLPMTPQKGFSQMETCWTLSLVKGSRVQPSQRSRSRIPAS